MVERLAVLSIVEPNDSEKNALKIAEFCGIAANIETIHPDQMTSTEFSFGLSSSCSALICSAHALRGILEHGIAIESLCGMIPTHVRNIFIYGFEGHELEKALVAHLTSGAIVSSARASTREYAVCPQTGDVCSQFSGIAITTPQAQSVTTFTRSQQNPQVRDLVVCEGKAFFTLVSTSFFKLFLSGSDRIADLETQTQDGAYCSDLFADLIPIMLFIRTAFGEWSWHSTLPQATFIIDDPYLKWRYGFVKYRELLAATRRQRFSANIAFIPWNSRRTQAPTARLFATNKASLSISVHGCDHTAREFGGSNEEELERKCHRALLRMRHMAKKWGIEFNRVMIFPQGYFSAKALSVLKRFNFVCAVNTSMYATDNSTSTMPLRDLLSVALMRYDCFAVFGRRYPTSLCEFVFDVFFGKPLLIVEHHTYFRNGYNALAKLTDQINRIDGGVSWSSLEEACATSHLVRRVEDGSYEIRFFTSRFRFVNDVEEQQPFVFTKLEQRSAALVSVTVNSVPAEYSFESGAIRIPLRLGKGTQVSIELTYQEPPVRPQKAGGALRESVRACCRRLASDLRDNLLSRMPALLAAAQRVVERKEAGKVNAER